MRPVRGEPGFLGAPGFVLLGGAFLYPGSLGEGMWDEGGWSSRREKGEQNYKEAADFYAVKYSLSKGAAWHWFLLSSSGETEGGSVDHQLRGRFGGRWAHRII